MQEITFDGLDEKLYYHENPSGLKTYMWTNEKVKSCYMSLNVFYGSVHTEFKVGNKKFQVPSGVAHFLEHVKFNESEDYTAHDYFLKSGGDANAFTTFNYTSYIVFTPTNFKDNLTHLLEFVYNPFFTKKLINKEKGIIVEEANMNTDDPYTYSLFLHLKNIFHNSMYKEFITGEPDDVKAITLDDVSNVYKAFYHPQNMFLCLCGNFNPYEMAKIIDETLEKIEFSNFIKPELIFPKEPKKVVKDYDEVYLNVSNPKVRYGIKIPRSIFKNYDNFTIKNVLDLVLNMNFGATSDLKDELITKGLINSLYSFTEIFDEYVLLLVVVDTDYVEEIIKRIEQQFANLDLRKEVIERKKKAVLANVILDFDDVENVNNRVQDNIINYGEVITDVLDRFRNIDYNICQDIINLIDFTNRSILVVKEKKEGVN